MITVVRGGFARILPGRRTDPNEPTASSTDYCLTEARHLNETLETHVSHNSVLVRHFSGHSYTVCESTQDALLAPLATSFSPDSPFSYAHTCLCDRAIGVKVVNAARGVRFPGRQDA